MKVDIVHFNGNAANLNAMYGMLLKRNVVNARQSVSLSGLFALSSDSDHVSRTTSRIVDMPGKFKKKTQLTNTFLNRYENIYFSL